jgi:hypothetical protein
MKSNRELSCEACRPPVRETPGTSDSSILSGVLQMHEERSARPDSQLGAGSTRYRVFAAHRHFGFLCTFRRVANARRKVSYVLIRSCAGYFPPEPDARLSGCGGRGSRVTTLRPEVDCLRRKPSTIRRRSWPCSAPIFSRVSRTSSTISSFHMVQSSSSSSGVHMIGASQPASAHAPSICPRIVALAMCRQFHVRR